ncbi:MAG: hypothetical protein J6P47_04820, partial [Acetobacter sp.]|nr:hypothetical protein [Acetobacter sp.]
MLSISLFVSLSGCAGSGWGTWSNNWNNITGGVRNYGQYPTPNAQTCFINPTTVNAKQQGLYNLAFQKERQGISAITLVKNYLLPATNKLAVQGNAQPLNSLLAQIQPQTLANFMIGCNEVVVQERNQLIQERQQLIQDANNQRNLIAKWQNYLNTTPAPQPTLQIFQEFTDSPNTHPEILKASADIANIYEAKPLLLALTLTVDTPVDQLGTLLKINTIQGLQNFQQQLQKEHLLSDGAPPSVPPLPPPPPPPINWAQYKTTFSSILPGVIERIFDPLLIKTSIIKLEQQLQGIHQQLQGVHQQLQGIHQQLQGLHQKLQQLHQAPQTTESFGTPQEILNTVESIHLPGLPPPPGL